MQQPSAGYELLDVEDEENETSRNVEWAGRSAAASVQGLGRAPIVFRFAVRI